MSILAARRHRTLEPVAGPLVVVQDVAVRSAETELLAPCSLAVDVGERVAVTGPNGTGKTTLLRVLAGLIPATTGTVRAVGRAPDERSGSTVVPWLH